ncbi:hypothetical protein CC78DRAFT_520848 [Lojkania enalia]|uniref:UBC core domain-containing protein n=1 Tax=Lojkania enalia TaxID=147567 RepID=A0A9P4K5J4_9PLEO|nr:hypothetical protein CC78DRAFT_520848 [Didymosphaeria enalia]
MPRRAFIADLQKAVDGTSIAGISNVQPGGDDGEFTFHCVAAGRTLEISALVPDVSEYPSNHPCMVFAGDDVPSRVANALSDISDSAMGKTIPQLLELVSRKLESTDRDGDKQMLDSQEDYGSEPEDEDDMEEEDEYFPDDELVARPAVGKQHNSVVPEGFTKPTSAFRNRIRSDLLVTKADGFKVGHLGGLMDGLSCYISVSCRVSKLGISEEAMRAWQVEPAEYLVVILHYPNGYKSMDSLRKYDPATARRNFEMRVGISTSYKPTMQEAVRAFTVLSKDEEKRREAESQTESQGATAHNGFRNSFISRPLNELLRERFPALLHYRYNGMPWHGAELFYNDHYGTNHHADLGLSDRYLELEQVSAVYPHIVMADHIQESMTQEHSLPLVGMQFVLRHFVRCTEFCLICFTKMPDDLQAIKPYVCENPLCLYQYMSLGFGPSIEHEILSQPKVVDLLISFCYTTARSGSLKDFPTGLSLMVPPNVAYEQDYASQPQSTYPGWNQTTIQNPRPISNTVAEVPQKVRYNAYTRELIFDDPPHKCPFRFGDWLVIRTADSPSQPFHCRVAETAYYPTVTISEPVKPPIFDPSQGYNAPYNSSVPQPPKPVAPVPPNEFRTASFYIYNQNFDDLNDFHKRETIHALLDLLPSVADMRAYLVRKAQSPLGSWVDRLSPAVLGILRWIIASNRACIVQVDDDDETSMQPKRGEERLYGMSGWAQFRFAMGAPDKERRFVQAVRDTTARLGLKYPTLYAWHGSPLHNWHSIIREGLHFKDTAHGRAFGHGVYHSLDVNTSIGYCGYGGNSVYTWPMSELKVNSALALNEIVNAPKEYVSSSPHLVVAQLDWIQTRYLFIKSTSASLQAPATTSAKETKPLQSIDQDPNMTPRGSSDKLCIPFHATSGSRRQQTRSVKTINKRRKATGLTVYDPIDIDAEEDDDKMSVATLEEDLIILEDEDVYVPEPEPEPLPTPTSLKGKSKAGAFLSKLVGSKSSKPLTDYVPGTLDYSSLPMLAKPTWATQAASKRLLKDFQELVKVQEREPPHELGWHVDPDHFDNMYQWIVELHSFDPTLPLSKDMKAKGIKSIVLELRFGKDYPMSPPFVRVIRPRFLGFQQGGGGHVTAGGAMCMELLTNDGWSAVSSIESVLLQVRMAMSSLEPKPARLEGSGRGEYGVGEAVEAYIRACNVHGWTVPPGFREMAYGGYPNDGSAYMY